MKTIKFFFSVVILSFFLVSCESESETTITLITFEEIKLNADSIWNGSDLSGKAIKELPSWGGDSIINYYGYFSVGTIRFENSYIPNPTSPSWSGFAASSKTDTITSGYANQYSVMNSSGAFGSKKFALAYNYAEIYCPTNTNENFAIKSIMVNNSTYAYLYMKGEFSAEKWYKVIIAGYLNNIKNNEVEYYLADFRKGKSFIVKEWTKIDLSSLGKVDKIAISFDSNDKSGTWFNNPTYVCIDNVEFTQTISTK